MKWQGVTISEAVDQWLMHCRQYSEDTQYAYKCRIQSFVKSLTIKTIGELAYCHYQTYIDSLLDSRSNRTANCHLVTLQSFSRWLAKTYDLPNIATEIEKLKEAPAKARFLTRDEYLKALSIASEKQSIVLRILANTGLRSAELRHLTWDCIKPDNTGIVFVGKGQKKRFIPANDTVQAILRETPHTHARLIYCWGVKKNRNILNGLCEQVSRDAGLPKFGPHALRHFFASELLRRGVPITYVSKLLGHSSIQVTESVYWHCVPEYLNGVTNILDE